MAVNPEAVRTPGSGEILRSPRLDALLVFGSGPVIDKDTREKAETSGTTPGSEDINFWSKTLADASAVLYKRQEAREIIVMGGKTGGEAFKSEAELISEEIGRQDMPNSVVKQEDRSVNTLLNIVNAANLYLDDPKNSGSYQKLGIVAQHFHLPRVRLLMHFFDVPYVTAFSSEKVVQWAAYQEGDMDKVKEIDERLEMASVAGNTQAKKPEDKQLLPYYEKQIGTERLDINTRFLQNDAYTKETMDVPEYWLCYVGLLKSDERIKRILNKVNPGMLQRFNIAIDDPIEKTRKKLLATERIDGDVHDLMRLSWTGGNILDLQQIIDSKNK